MVAVFADVDGVCEVTEHEFTPELTFLTTGTSTPQSCCCWSVLSAPGERIDTVEFTVPPLRGPGAGACCRRKGRFLYAFSLV